MNVALIWDHLSLVLSALILAVGVGVPLGLLAYLFPRFGKAILWVVDLIQTVPALPRLPYRRHRFDSIFPASHRTQYLSRPVPGA